MLRNLAVQVPTLPVASSLRAMSTRAYFFTDGDHELWQEALKHKEEASKYQGLREYTKALEHLRVAEENVRKADWVITPFRGGELASIERNRNLLIALRDEAGMIKE